jgi:hypothetical protein
MERTASWLATPKLVMAITALEAYAAKYLHRKELP